MRCATLLSQCFWLRDLETFEQREGVASSFKAKRGLGRTPLQLVQEIINFNKNDILLARKGRYM